MSKTKGISELAPEPFSDDFNVDYLKTSSLGRGAL